MSLRRPRLGWLLLLGLLLAIFAPADTIGAAGETAPEQQKDLSSRLAKTQWVILLKGQFLPVFESFGKDGVGESRFAAGAAELAGARGLIYPIPLVRGKMYELGSSIPLGADLVGALGPDAASVKKRVSDGLDSLAPTLEPQERSLLTTIRVRILKADGQDFLHISCCASDPRAAARVSQKVLAHVIQKLTEETIDSLKEHREFLRVQVDGSRRIEKSAMEKKLKMELSHPYLTRPDGLPEQLRRAREAVQVERARRQAAQDRLGEIRALTPGRTRPASSPSGRLTVANPKRRELQADLDKLEQERQALLGKYKPNHPKVKDKEVEIRTAKRALEECPPEVEIPSVDLVKAAELARQEVDSADKALELLLPRQRELQRAAADVLKEYEQARTNAEGAKRSADEWQAGLEHNLKALHREIVKRRTLLEHVVNNEAVVWTWAVEGDRVVINQTARFRVHRLTDDELELVTDSPGQPRVKWTYFSRRRYEAMTPQERIERIAPRKIE